MFKLAFSILHQNILTHVELLIGVEFFDYYYFFKINFNKKCSLSQQL